METAYTRTMLKGNVLTTKLANIQIHRNAKWEAVTANNNVTAIKTYTSGLMQINRARVKCTIICVGKAVLIQTAQVKLRIQVDRKTCNKVFSVYNFLRNLSVQTFLKIARHFSRSGIFVFVALSEIVLFNLPCFSKAYA